MLFFFFFQNQLYNDDFIRQAFKKVCLDKMLIDGYFDMRKYVEGKIDRLELYVKLKKCKSRFADLFKKDYPKTEDGIMGLWYSVVESRERFNANQTNVVDLNADEADAIVYWVYQVFDKKDREEITSFIFDQEKELNGINCKIDYEYGIPYNSEKIEIKFIKNISDFYSIITEEDITKRLFYRGHSNANYLLFYSELSFLLYAPTQIQRYNVEEVLIC